MQDGLYFDNVVQTEPEEASSTAHTNLNHQAHGDHGSFVLSREDFERVLTVVGPSSSSRTNSSTLSSKASYEEGTPYESAYGASTTVANATGTQTSTYQNAASSAPTMMGSLVDDSWEICPHCLFATEEGRIILKELIKDDATKAKLEGLGSDVLNETIQSMSESDSLEDELTGATSTSSTTYTINGPGGNLQPSAYTHQLPNAPSATQTSYHNSPTNSASSNYESLDAVLATSRASTNYNNRNNNQQSRRRSNAGTTRRNQTYAFNTE